MMTAMGVGHSHATHRHRAHRDHEPQLQVGRTPRLVLLACLVLVGLVTVVGVVALWPDGSKVGQITGRVNFAAPGVTFPTGVVEAVHPPCAGSDQRDQT